MFPIVKSKIITDITDKSYIKPINAGGSKDNDLLVKNLQQGYNHLQRKQNIQSNNEQNPRGQMI